MSAELLLWAVSLSFWFYYGWNVRRWNWSRCKCGRERLPWLAYEHEKEYLMWAYFTLVSLVAVFNALFGQTMWSLVSGLVAVWQYRVIHEHRKGKRSVLGRLLGRVVITEHGRLAVQP